MIVDLNEIIKHLPGDWKVLEGHIFPDIGYGDYILYLSNFKPVGRITVTGKLPCIYGEPYEWDGYKITISAKKTPEQIAKDIARRFLPKYYAKFKTVADSIEQVKQEASRLKGQVQEIVDILGYLSDIDDLYINYTKYTKHIGFDFGGLPTSGLVDINLRVSLEQAKKVAKLLKEMGLALQ